MHCHGWCYCQCRHTNLHSHIVLSFPSRKIRVEKIWDVLKLRLVFCDDCCRFYINNGSFVIINNHWQMSKCCIRNTVQPCYLETGEFEIPYNLKHVMFPGVRHRISRTFGCS